MAENNCDRNYIPRLLRQNKVRSIPCFFITFLFAKIDGIGIIRKRGIDLYFYY